MLTKLSTFRGVSPSGEPLVRLFKQGDSIQKVAAGYQPEVQDFLSTYTSDKKKIALLVNAMGGSEYWGQNVNGDVYPWAAIAHDNRGRLLTDYPYDSFYGKRIPPYGFRTFLDAYPFVHHRNKDPGRAFGDVAVSCLNEMMKRVELVVLIDRELASLHDAQPFVDRIDAGEFPDVSMGCFTAGTMVTMADGTRKPIEDVEVGDCVITHEGRSRKVTEVHVRKYKGDLYSIKPEAHPAIHCTHAHEFLSVDRPQVKHKDDHANWKWNDELVGDLDWVSAEDLHRREQFLLEPIFAAEPRSTPYPLSGTREEARLLGYYLAEGHILRNKKKETCGIELTTHEDDHVHCEIDDLCSSFGTMNTPSSFRRSNSEVSVGLSIFDKELAMLCLRHGSHYSNSKKLSSEVMAAGDEYIKELLGAYGNGDGCGSDGTLKFSTSSEDLAYQVQLLLLRIGCMASLSKIVHPPSGFAVEETTEWVVHVGKQWIRILEPYCAKAQQVEVLKARNSRLRMGDHIVTPVREVSSLYVETDVYNLEVEEDRSYLVEGVAVHNCRVPYDTCTICGHKSRTKDDYCEHVKILGMNRILDDGRRVGVVNDYPRFFDISFVFIGADRTAKVMCKLASGIYAPQSVVDGERIYTFSHTSHDLDPGITKAASVDDLVERAEKGEKELTLDGVSKSMKEWTQIFANRIQDAAKEEKGEKVQGYIENEPPKFRTEFSNEGPGYGDGVLRTNSADGTDGETPDHEKAAEDMPTAENLKRIEDVLAAGQKVINTIRKKVGQEKGASGDMLAYLAERRKGKSPKEANEAAGKSKIAKKLQAPPPRDQFPYQGQYKWNGMTIHVENTKGTWRVGKGWKTHMKYDYGEIKDSLGADNDPVDVYVGPHEKAKDVYIIHQNHVSGPKRGEYDEDKLLLGFRNPREAKKAYLAHYDRPGFFRSITEMSMKEFKKMIFRPDSKGEKIAEVDDQEKVAVNLKLEDLFEGAEGAVRRERVWKDKATGHSTYHRGSGLGNSFSNMQKTAAEADAELTEVFKVSGAKQAGDKLADVIKEVYPNDTTGRVVEDLSAREQNISKDVLNESCKCEEGLEGALATPSMMGMVLKPEEFQRILLSAIGKPGMADDLDSKGTTFNVRGSSGTSAPCGPLGPEHFSPDLMQKLLPMLKGRSYLGPVIRKRVIQITITPKAGAPARGADSPLLSKVGAAYNWYRTEMLKVATHAPEVVGRHPDLHAGLFGSSDPDLFSKRAAELPVNKNTIATVIASVPLALMYSAALRRDIEEGDDVGLIKRLIADHPHLTALGTGALVRELMKNKEVNRIVGNIASEAAGAGRRILTGGA